MGVYNRGRLSLFTPGRCVDVQGSQLIPVITWPGGTGGHNVVTVPDSHRPALRETRG